jgi:DNA end-binding protein Ku
LTVEKFVEAGSIDPVFYDSAYYVVPDGDAGKDVYAVLREAVAKTGMVALSRVVISQRERTIALRPLPEGLMAHTLFEERDINSAADLFDGTKGVKIDPEMVQLATQLVKRQVGKYDAGDLEDRYEARLRALIDAKLKGEGLEPGDEPQLPAGNVIDLMAALKKSLGQDEAAKVEVPAPRKNAAPKKKAAAAARQAASRKRA